MHLRLARPSRRQPARPAMPVCPGGQAIEAARQAARRLPAVDGGQHRPERVGGQVVRVARLPTFGKVGNLEVQQQARPNSSSTPHGPTWLASRQSGSKQPGRSSRCMTLIRNSTPPSSVATPSGHAAYPSSDCMRRSATGPELRSVRHSAEVVGRSALDEPDHRRACHAASLPRLGDQSCQLVRVGSLVWPLQAAGWPWPAGVARRDASSPRRRRGAASAWCRIWATRHQQVPHSRRAASGWLLHSRAATACLACHHRSTVWRKPDDLRRRLARAPRSAPHPTGRRSPAPGCARPGRPPDGCQGGC